MIHDQGVNEPNSENDPKDGSPNLTGPTPTEPVAASLDHAIQEDPALQSALQVWEWEGGALAAPA